MTGRREAGATGLSPCGAKTVSRPLSPVPRGKGMKRTTAYAPIERLCSSVRVRSSRLGLSWADASCFGCCPQVKRAQPTRCGEGSSGLASLLLGAVFAGDLHGEVLEFGEQGAEFLGVVE